jgi:transposase-like protein
MTGNDVAQSMICPDCGHEMRLKAHLPPTDTLPAVAGYWCDECRKDLTIEIDAEAAPRG